MIKKWQLQSKRDISPSEWFPLEARTYLLPNGKVIEDFYVTTLADSVHILARTTHGKIIMIRMFKQGIDEIVIQFPAGRLEDKHTDLVDAAVHELEEETGVKANAGDLRYAGKLSLMSTKASELAHYYFVDNVAINSTQNLDETEEIEVLEFTPQQIETMINTGEIWDAPAIAGWELVKRKFLN